MSDGLASLRHRIDGAQDLQSVVRTMKAVAAASIGKYERAAQAVDVFQHTVELSLGVALRAAPAAAAVATQPAGGPVGAVIFGSDQGLVGQYNEQITALALKTLEGLGDAPRIWVVGARAADHLVGGASGRGPEAVFSVPKAVEAVGPLVERLLVASQADGGVSALHLFYNQRGAGAVYTPTHTRLLPLDATWHRRLVERRWPSHALPEVLGALADTLPALIGALLYIGLFGACAHALAAESASRLSAMQRAEENINELLATTRRSYFRLRQGAIDEELFDVVLGSEALKPGQ